MQMVMLVLGGDPWVSWVSRGIRFFGLSVGKGTRNWKLPVKSSGFGLWLGNEGIQNPRSPGTHIVGSCP